MSHSITEVGPGDYVRITSGAYLEIARIFGVLADGRLAKPSEGGFGVVTTEGRTVGMYEARAYLKRADLEPK